MASNMSCFMDPKTKRETSNIRSASFMYIRPQSKYLNQATPTIYMSCSRKDHRIAISITKKHQTWYFREYQTNWIYSWICLRAPSQKKILYFVWSPPWHLYILLLENLLAFYLTYLLAVYLPFYLAYLLAYYLLKSSGILSGKHSGTLSGISSGILSDILSGILSGIPSGILSGISSNILSGISPGTLSGISYGILSGTSSRILSDILSGISSGILSGFWGPAVRTDSEGPRLRSSGVHWARQVPGWGPAVRTELGRSQVEVQRCALSWEGPRLRSSSAHWAPKLAKSLAKSWQGNSGRGSGGRGGRRGGGRGGGGRRRTRRRRMRSWGEQLW